MSKSKSKLITLSAAIEKFVPDGASVAIGMALEAMIPFAAGHEIIRQGRRDLTLIGPISDILFDQLIGAGTAQTVMAAWVGNVNRGSSHAFRRAVEAGIPRPIELHDHSNFTLALALTAASLGAPFIPTQSTLGSELSSTNVDLIERINPLNEAGEPLQLVRALHPDVAIIHVQRASASGGAHLWGMLGLSREAALAARHVILTAEEIVDESVIDSDPNRVLLPPFRVAAVAHVPGGAHPASVPGYYGRDHAFFDGYAAETQSEAGMESWLRQWVFGHRHREDYLEEIGAARWQALQRTGSALAAAVDYGVHV